MISDGDDETDEVTPWVRSIVAMRLMKVKKSTLVEMLAQYGVLLRARATKHEVADALAEQLLYETDSDESDAEEDAKAHARRL